MYMPGFRDDAQFAAREQARQEGVAIADGRPSNRAVAFGSNGSTQRGGFGSSSAFGRLMRRELRTPRADWPAQCAIGFHYHSVGGTYGTNRAATRQRAGDRPVEAATAELHEMH